MSSNTTTRPAPAPHLDSEITTAARRAVAGVAMQLMWLAGGLSGHRVGPWITGGVGYAVAVFFVFAWWNRRGDDYPRVLRVAVTVLDNAIILAFAALTGGITSPIVAILLLVVTTNVARYGVRVALVVAGSDAALLVLIGATVHADHASTTDRLRLTAWWSWLLVGGAISAGVLAKTALDARRARDRARGQAEAERLRAAFERQARRKLEVAEADRRDFLRVVTHELRTPIASIGALARALDRGGNTTTLDVAGSDEALGLIRSHAEHLGRMLESVRDLATPEVASARVVLTDVCLPELVRSSVSAAGVGLERLRVDVGPGTATIRTDEEKLRRILTNILENAGRHSLAAVDVAARRDDGYLTVRVAADRGPGLRAEVAARAFEKGFSFGPERGASGLGLWIVSELAGQLGGRVRAEAREGGGLVVAVRLPLPAGRG